MVRKPITQDVDGLGEQGRNFKVWLVTRGGAQSAPPQAKSRVSRALHKGQIYQIRDAIACASRGNWTTHGIMAIFVFTRHELRLFS